MKGEIHISYILTLFADYADRNNILTDKVFADTVELFNAVYRKGGTQITEQDAMDEMVGCKSYTYFRNDGNWWIVNNFSQNRYSLLAETLNDGLKDHHIYFVQDTHTKKNIHAVRYSANNGEKTLGNAIDIIVGKQEAQHEIALWSKVYNEQFEAYDLEIIKYIFD